MHIFAQKSGVGVHCVPWEITGIFGGWIFEGGWGGGYSQSNIGILPSVRKMAEKGLKRNFRKKLMKKKFLEMKFHSRFMSQTYIWNKILILKSKSEWNTF